MAAWTSRAAASILRLRSNWRVTLVEPKPQRLLERHRLGLPDLFHGPDVLRQNLAARTLPAELQSAFEKAGDSLQNSLAAIRESLAKLDRTLVDAAQTAGSKMHYQLDRLRTQAAQAEARHSELVSRHAETLSWTLYPEKSLQEREIAGVYFVARYGTELLRQLYDHIHTDCHDHKVIEL